tara:strand:- start:121 stop:222 length:102 start_codon:yes stop_codon:yes gene_type:complete
MEENKSGLENISFGLEGNPIYSFEIKREEERIC